MLKKNRAALRIVVNPRVPSEKIVHDLIEAGLLVEDVKTEPEEMAEAAKAWCSGYTYNYAVGWSNNGWRAVLGLDEDSEEFVKHIFPTLVILAKEEGVKI